MILLGFLINFFDKIDPADLENLGLIKRILAIYCRLGSLVLKVIHYAKTLIVMACIFFAFFNNTLGYDYLTDPTFNSTLYDPICTNVTIVNTTYVSSFKTQVQIFSFIELISIFFVLCVCGIIKNLIYISGLLYEPEDYRIGKVRTILMRSLGP